MSGIAEPLAAAADAAGYAPSIHNTQPWAWRVLPDRLALSADRGRQLAATDPDGRLMLLSCGTALEHARLALLAQGWAARVDYLPDPARPDLLAELVPGERVDVTPEAVRMVDAMPVRHTDRRPVSAALPADADAAIVSAAHGLARLHRLTGDQVLELAAAAHRAAEIEADDPLIRAELAYWTSRSAPEGTGLPPDVLPGRAPETTVPARDFGVEGTLPIGPGHDKDAEYVLLYGDDDAPASWLRAGMALAAVWLTAVQRGVSVVPLSGVVEVATTRTVLRGILSGVGYPYLVIRLGVGAPGETPRTPRLPVDQTVERG
ncbi:Acg family FMN-binding oxidoreductase [Asanoa iriomotensis]|uniref:NAD(P)H nitroreductase n=1 Tax=Asanoa iriomotensis TaxID=234613 RepID=A0ABQ4BY93_9ACTN|nr:nitroreductase [Asanoa iriomotensis]GIF55505.1 NAD(P)H nitroreductase [Asanoa iriomotensis]